LLESIRRHGLLLQLDAGASVEPAASTLLALDEAGRMLVLDAPRRQQHAEFRPGRHIGIETTHEGIRLRFRCRIRSAGEHQGRPALLVDWPGEVEYQQRRKSFRVRLYGVSDAQLDLFLDGRFSLRAKMVDVSAEGFAALVDPDAPLSANERIECAVRIDENMITAMAEIRNLRAVYDDRYLRLGARFLDLQRRDRLRLERLVRELERRTIRQINRDSFPADGPTHGTRRR
jgi:c-di-GMP-binding flagellar brake protein YcgR